jgi:UDP-N-acetylmuramoyl-tripeptide--D-alanyl-D-alanine ligase
MLLMARMGLAEIAAATRGNLALGAGAPAAGADRTIDGWSIDSRSLAPDDMFFAIVGPRVDGHDFVDAALERGAAGAVVARGGPGRWPRAAALVKVADTTRALQDLGGHARRRRALRVVGITGSAGKTTAKEMTAAVLATRWRTHRSQGNLNNTWGLPLTLLRMPDDAEAAVLEMGMSSKGEIARLVEIADPDIGVILNVLRVHLEHFSGIDAIAAAKGELFAGMRRDAVAVWNADDPRVARLGRTFPGPSLAFGLTGRGREVTAEDVACDGVRGTRFVLRRGEARAQVRLALPGRQHVHNALAAAAVGFACGLEAEAIARGLATVEPAAMRGVLHRRPDGAEVLDDSYNSNPAAMERAIELLSEASPRGRRILAAGDMLELGPYASRAHARVGALAAGAGLDLFVAVGPLMEKAASAAGGSPRGTRGTGGAGRGRGAGSARDGARRRAAAMEVRHFGDAAEAARWLAGAIRPGDLVLVKGSRGMRMERIVQALTGGADAAGAGEAH